MAAGHALHLKMMFHVFLLKGMVELKGMIKLAMVGRSSFTLYFLGIWV
jgi:hypothetical protein